MPEIVALVESRIEHLVKHLAHHVGLGHVAPGCEFLDLLTHKLNLDLALAIFIWFILIRVNLAKRIARDCR